MSAVEEKREREKEVVSLMISLYCRKKHGSRKGELCQKCRELNDYARMRSDKCPFMETKTFCSSCKVHCYRKDMRQQIRKVMAFSGPRLLLSHPVLVVRHGLETLKAKGNSE